jgi:hypothetical protein
MKEPLPDRSVVEVKRISSTKGISSYTESGKDRSVVFSDGVGGATSITMKSDMENFSALAVMRLVEYFSPILSVSDFWPKEP